MKHVHKKDIENLLDLDGIVVEQRGGYWTKFEVRRVTITDKIPHGMRYSLTLHDRHGQRVMGFDNAHAVNAKKGKKHQAKKTYDHKHRYLKNMAVPYEFIDAYQLINDFWAEVDNVLSLLGLYKEDYS